MLTSRDYDIIITGGGPAGSTAGYLLSRAGFRVLIIDKSTFPRKKLCAGLITYKTRRLLERVFGETANDLKSKGIINYESNRYEVFGRKRKIARRTINIPFMFADRDVYDTYLLSKAREAGAEILEGETVRSLDVMKSLVTTKSGNTFSAGIILGADGVNSRVRRTFLTELFGRTDWSNHVAAAFEIFISRDRSQKQFSHPMLFYGFVKWGYAWIFPNRDRLKIGMCALKYKNHIKIINAFWNFLAEMNICDLQEAEIQSYVLPYGCFLPYPVFRNIILAGDAAGFADPLLGEGIFFAQRSAELASEAIIRLSEMGNDLRNSNSHKLIENRYLTLLNEHIYPELIYAGKIQNTIFTYLDKFDYLPLKILMNMFGNMPMETVQGARSYRWMRKTNNKSQISNNK